MVAVCLVSYSTWTFQLLAVSILLAVSSQGAQLASSSDFEVSLTTDSDVIRWKFKRKLLRNTSNSLTDYSEGSHQNSSVFGSTNEVDIAGKVNAIERFTVELWLKSITGTAGESRVIIDAVLFCNESFTVHSNESETDGLVLYPCDCFITAGQFELIARNYRDGSILANKDITSNQRIWKVSADRHLVPLTMHLIVNLSFVIDRGKQGSCRFNSLGSSFLHQHLVLRILYASLEDMFASSMNESSAVFHDQVVITEIRVNFTSTSSLLRSSGKITEKVPVNCASIDRTGVYKAVLVMLIANSSEIILEESAPIAAQWSESPLYHLRIPNPSIFPCPDNGFPIGYLKPACATSADKIRLYALPQGSIEGFLDSVPSNFVAEKLSLAKEKLIYKGEVRVSDDGGSQMSVFGCDHFDLIYPGYCFVYVSVAANGLVKRHTTKCLPTEIRPMPKNGQWQSWESWGQCTASCGDVGVQHRVRRCKMPKPRHGSRFCEGPSAETRICDLGLCPNETQSTTTLRSTLKENERCQCGCELTTDRPGVVVMPTNHHCKTESPVWIVKAPNLNNQHVKMRFVTFNGQLRETIRIRDGQNAFDALLFDSNRLEGSQLVSLPHPWFVSTNNALRIEFTLSSPESLSATSTDVASHVSRANAADDIINDLQFSAFRELATVLEYNIIDRAEYHHLVRGGVAVNEEPWWWFLVNIAIIAGISALIVSLLIVTIAFSYRCTTAKLRRKCALLRNSDSIHNDGGLTKLNSKTFDPLMCGANRLSCDSEKYTASQLKYNRISQISSDSSSTGGSLTRQPKTASQNSGSHETARSNLKVVVSVEPSPHHQSTPKRANVDIGLKCEAKPLIHNNTAAGENKQQAAIIHLAKTSRQYQNGVLQEIPEVDDDDAEFAFNQSMNTPQINLAITPSPLLSELRSPQSTGPPKKRSIGIQLNSPALSLRRQLASHLSSDIRISSNSLAASGSSRQCDSPSPSWAGTEQDFEYDYYEPSVPGSFLNPNGLTISWTDQDQGDVSFIDEIIAESDLMKTPTPPDSTQSK